MKTLEEQRQGQTLHTNVGFSVEDALEEYTSKREILPRGSEQISIPDGYDRETHQQEIQMAQLLSRMYGEKITLLNEINQRSIKTPDYEWLGKYWDLKEISTEKSADSAVRKGLKQIAENPGGLIFSYVEEHLDLEKLIKFMDDRVKRSKTRDVDILVYVQGVLKLARKYSNKK